MTRIVAGQFGGRTLRTPRGAGTRPTSERVREALFSRLEHLDVLGSARVLDLYAGSGALGLEAISRGAASAVLVESARPVARLARHNARDLGVYGQVQVIEAPVARFCATMTGGEPYSLVFADPPYDLDESALGGVLSALTAPGVLAPGAVVVAERAVRSPEPAWPNGLERMEPRTYGETRLWLARYAPGDNGQDEPAGS